MQNIQMVDLTGQYQKIKKEVDQAIQQVIDQTAFINGPDVKNFAAELSQYLGAKHVIPCANGTDALQIALMALELKPGDEIITPNFTFISTVEVAALLNLKPVLVDVNPDTFNIDPEQVRKAITPRTKVIIPVHLFGQCADIESIMQIAREHNLYVIEDTAQAIGSEYQLANGKKAKAGTIGQIGCTSFFPSKNLGAFGDAGALYTNDDALAEKIRFIANHGMKVKYHYSYIGVNSRLDTLQAALLRVKLRHLDEYNKARQDAAAYYDKELSSVSGLQIPARYPESTHVFHQYTLKINNGKRDELKNFLEKKNIPSMIYYPKPFHTQEAFQYLGYQPDDFPVTRALCDSVLSLPMHTELSDDQLNYITSAIKEFFN